MKFELERPNLAHINRAQTIKAILGDRKTEILDFLKRIGADHLYWDALRHKEPSPKGISKEQLWLIVKLIRESQAIGTVISDKEGNAYSWIKLDYFEEFFHELDLNTGGELFVEKGKIDKTNKQKLISRGIMEEAIASSQLEGAATSRLEAKKILREGRAPTNKSEQMIVNNYNSMKAIEDDYKKRPLSMDLLLELHAMTTKNTLDSAGEKPRMRRPGEQIFVNDDIQGIIYHEAPDIEFVKPELEKLIKFANDENGGNGFIHPVIKAIMLHFWLGYLHPFTDGNGRLARLLFYWYLVNKGYWAFIYLPISKIIKKAHKQYIMAYVYSEQDDNDLTYFIDYNLKRIKMAVKEFEKYLEEQAGKNVQMKKKSEVQYALNIRQVQLLQYLHNVPDEYTTLKTHMNINQVTRMTASKDLNNLVNKGLLTSNKQGRTIFYYGTDKIKQLFAS